MSGRTCGDLAYAMMILNWAKHTFGPVAMDPVERASRVLEEACEVAQAEGVPLERQRAILERTNRRPVGDNVKEVGGLLVATYGLCALRGNDPLRLLDEEAVRVTSRDPEEWRRKHAEKVADGTAG